MPKRTGRALALALVLSLLALAPAGQSARANPGTFQMARDAFGFFVYRDSDYMLHQAQYDVLSTVAFASIVAEADGSLLTQDGGQPTPEWAAWNAPWMDEVINLAHGAGCRVVLTVSRFAWSAADRLTTVQLLSDPAARTRLVDAIADAVTERGVDGVNLDFEPIPKAVKWQFVDLVRELRAELDRRAAGLELTFDATARGGGYAIPELTASDAADAVFVMAYPFHDGGSKRAGATSPLGGPSYDVAATVNRFLGLTSADKVILGLPYYGYEWSTTSKKANSPTRPSGATYGSPVTRKVSDAWTIAAQHGRRWSATEHVPWTRWRYRACPSCPLTWRQLYFEDVQSLGLKYDLVNTRGLRGVGFWKLGNDTGRPELYDLLRTKFAAQPVHDRAS